MVRFIDANFAQHIANVELSPDNAGIVQWVLSHTPTIDAAIVVYGRWIPCDFAGNAKCSACGEVFKECNFCPNCGAKMVGEAK